MRKSVLFKSLLALALVLISGSVWAQSDRSNDYTGNVTLTTDGGTSASACKVKVDGVEYDGIKAGTSKAAGAIKITVPSGTKYLHLHVAAWNNETVTLSVTPSGYSESIALTANSGISNNSPFSFSGDPSTSDFYKVITFANALTAETDLTFTATSGKRFVVWGVTAEDEVSSAVATTITIDASGITNTDFFEGTAAGKLTATVKAGENVISGAVVTWTSTKEAVATITDAGVVTIVAPGTTTLKASYAGIENQYKPSSANYELIVTNSDPNRSGTEGKPFTVAQARDAIDLYTPTTIEGVYISGKVSQVDKYNDSDKSITYWISDDGTTTDQFEAYHGKGLNGAEFTAIGDVQVGDVVVVCGDILLFNGSTYEFSSGNKLVKQERAVEMPTFSLAAGTYTETQTVTISCTTQGATIYYTIDGTEPTNTSTEYAQAITIQRTTTLKAIAYKGNDKSAVATAIFEIVDPNGPGSEKNPYTVDQARAAIDAGAGVTGVYATGIVSKIVTAYSADYQNISFNISADGTEAADQLQAYRCKKASFEGAPSVDDIQVGDVVVVYGNLTKFKETYEFAQDNQLMSLDRPGDNTASITVDPTSVEVDADEHLLELGVVLKNIDLDGGVTVLFYEAKGETEKDYDWITGDYNKKSGKAEILVGANTGDARTAYLKVVGFDADAELIYSDLVTITQAKPVQPAVDYATLPFAWEGGASADLLALNGVTAEGLGSDYAESNAPYRVKLDDTKDYIQIKTDKRPGKLSVGVKMIGGNKASTITVQGSADGVTFIDVEELTISGAQNAELSLETTFDFAENDRYVRLLFTKGSNVGVGPISIAEYVYVAPEKHTISLGTLENVKEIFVFDESDLNNPLADGATVNSGTTIIISPDPEEGYEMKEVSVKTVDGDVVPVTDNSDQDGTWTFKMPKADVTISATAEEIIPVTTSLYKLATTVVPGKHYIIVGMNDDDYYAMAEQSSNNRKAVKVTKIEDGISVKSDEGVYEFVISNCSAGYVIVDESADGFLYAASSSSNQLKTTATLSNNGKWSIDFDAESAAATIKAQGESTRNWMRFNLNNGSPIFACYAETSTLPDVYLYVKDGEESDAFYKVFEYDYATLCLPFAAVIPDGVEAFYASGYSDDAVTLTKLTDNIIPANNGVVVSGEANKFKKFVKTTQSSRIPENYLKGVTEKKAFDAVEGYNASKRYYAMAAVEGEAKFCLVEGGSYAANTAYLELPAGASQTLGLRFGDATMVEAIETSAEQSVIYDLTGRRVEKATKGLYIVNGKKVFMK